MRKKIKNAENKGFTLVELIVVLVILAILAAILVPALLGYIDKAKGQNLVINGKNALTAVQTVAIEGYAQGNKKTRDYFIDYPNYAPIKRSMEIADTPAPSGFIFGMQAEGAWNEQSKEAKAGNHDAWTVKRVLYWEGNRTSNPPAALFNGEEWITGMNYYDAIKELYNSGEYYLVEKDSKGKVTAYSMWNLSDTVFTDITLPH